MDDDKTPARLPDEGQEQPKQDPMEDKGTGSDIDGSDATGSGPEGGENDPASGGGNA